MRFEMLARLFLATLTIAGFTCSVHADDAKQLTDLGAEVKTKDGVIIEANANVESWTAENYRLLAKQTDLINLTLSGKTINDENLKTLTSLTKLESLSTNASHLTDDAYKHFQSFPKLKRLALWHPSRNIEDFTGEGLRHLKPLSQLKQLTFAGAKTGDKAMSSLAELTQLESYSQWHNNETANGLTQLAKLSNLKTLRLGQRLYDYKTKPPASFDNATFEILATMKNLESLDIMEARLDFESLAKLKALPNLQKMHIHKTDISKDDIEKLKTALPNVEINWQPLTQQEEEATLIKKLKI